MFIDKALLSKKLDFLNRHLATIEEMRFDEEVFVDDADIHDLIAFRLQQAVETCIDIATHIIAAENFARKETAKDAFILLGAEKIIDKGLSSRMGFAADFRNRVVHGYDDFDYHLLYRDYHENISDLRQFGKEILKFMKRS